MATFRTNPEPLSDLLANVASGKIQLPDFQRGWVWDDYRIRALLASISRGFPIGAVMTLDAGGDVNFATRLVEGVDGEANGVLEQFLLDGQQRLTSLYQALKSPAPVTTHDSRGGRIKRWYYVNMLKAMDATMDREDAIVSVPEEKKVTRNFGRELVLDLSTPEQEYANHMMPTERLLNPMSWMLAYLGYWQGGSSEPHPTGNPTSFFEQFNYAIIDAFAGYQLPVISLGKETPKEAVCTVFEKVNTGGVTLTVFELVTASFAASNFSLRDDWDERRRRMRRESVLHGVEGEHFLQAVSLLATQQRRRNRQQGQPNAPANQLPRIGCQKRDVLNLTLDEYQTWADKVEHGFFQSAKFLHSQYVFKPWDVPYNTQRVPLAVLFVELGSALGDANAKERLEHWYWSGIFGEAYGSAVETQYARDLEQVANYVRNGTLPDLVNEANFVPERLVSLRTRQTAYKGLYALQMKSGAADWRTGSTLTLQTHHDEAIDIHHIFPVAWCQSDPPIPSDLYNSIINKTPIDAGTNRMIGGRAPSDYLPRLRSRYSNLDEALHAHWLDPELLEDDDFFNSFIDRGEQMLSLIGKAMGKDISGGREVFRNALLRLMPEGLIPEGEVDDAEDTSELQEFDDGENEYDDLGLAVYDGDDDEAA